YALMPLAFRALAYGILPTIFAQWLAVAAIAYILAVWRQRWRFEWVIATLLLSLALLAFPTVALFLSLVLVCWFLHLFFEQRQSRTEASEIMGAATYWRIPVMLAVSWTISIVAYYVLYISTDMTYVAF